VAVLVEGDIELPSDRRPACVLIATTFETELHILRAVGSLARNPKADKLSWLRGLVSSRIDAIHGRHASHRRASPIRRSRAGYHATDVG